MFWEGVPDDWIWAGSKTPTTIEKNENKQERPDENDGPENNKPDTQSPTSAKPNGS